MQKKKKKSTIARFYRKDLEYNKINKVFLLLESDIRTSDFGRFPKNLVGNGKKGGNYKL